MRRARGSAILQRPDVAHPQAPWPAADDSALSVDDAVNTRESSRSRIGSGWWAGVPRRTRPQKTKSSIPPETYSPTPVM